MQRFLLLLIFESIHQTSQSTHIWGYCLEAKDKVQNEKENAGKQQGAERHSTGEFLVHTHVPHVYHAVSPAWTGWSVQGMLASGEFPEKLSLAI